MKRILAGVGAFLLPTVLMMTLATPLMAQSNSTYVVKKNQDSPARVSCLSKCQETARKSQADCNKSSDPVDRAYCLKRVDPVYNNCTKKCPAK
jgi:type II secretory pathway component PulM